MDFTGFGGWPMSTQLILLGSHAASGKLNLPPWFVILFRTMPGTRIATLCEEGFSCFLRVNWNAYFMLFVLVNHHRRCNAASLWFVCNSSGEEKLLQNGYYFGGLCLSNVVLFNFVLI